MNSTRQDNRSQPGRRAMVVSTCPSCGAEVSADAKWCASCNFTGAYSMVMFPGPPPPLMPVLDAAGLWSAGDVSRIETARGILRGRFPQFHFNVCTVMLPSETKLPVFGFWLLNASPLNVEESAEDRAWTVLLLINARTGQAAVVPGYSAEPWLSDEEWTKVLSHMAPRWKAGNSAGAVAAFFESSAVFLDRAWKLHGLSLPNNSHS